MTTEEEKKNEIEKKEKKMIEITWQKIIAEVLITAMFIFFFVMFLYYFNLIYKIDSDDLKIVLKGGSPLQSSNNFFLLFGFLSSLGCVARIIFDFVGHTCYTMRFNFKIWWPWYFSLPILAFILGTFFVILFDNSLFGGQNGTNGIVKFPFILAFITGFAVTDAIGFLRDLSKRIFGSHEKNK